MVKARQATIHIEMIDSDGKVEMRGKLNAIQDALCVALIESAKEGEDVRKMVRKVCKIVLQQTENRNRRAWEWMHTLKVGVFVIPGVYGVMWLIGEIGHALGVM